MADTKKHDPLDPLEAAYTGTGEEEAAGESDVFHGEPITEGETPADAPPYDPSTAPPPPPPASPIQRILRLLPFVGGFLLLLLLIYFGYRFIAGRGADGGPAELTYWALWEEEEVMRPLLEKYQKDNPNITINFVRQTPIQYRERLEAHISRGEGPDIFRFHNTWVPMLREELAPLPKDIMSKDEFNETFYSVMAEDLTLGGEIVGLPLMFEGLVVFYNTDILSAGGYQAPADNWDDFLVQAEQLTVKDQRGNIVTAGAALGRADNVEHFSDTLALLMLQNGANPAKPNSEAGVGALSFYRLFAQVPDNVWGVEFDNDILSFAGGKTAMIFAPSWEVFTIRAISPELAFATAPVPQVAGGTSQVSWASYWAEGVNSRSPHQKQAWDLLRFLSRKETLEEFYALASQTRSFGEAYPRKDMAESLADNEYLSALVGQAETARSFYMASRTFDNGINDRIIQYYRDAVNSLDEGNSPAAALDTAAQGITQVLQSYNVKVE